MYVLNNKLISLSSLIMADLDKDRFMQNLFVYTIKNNIQHNNL